MGRDNYNGRGVTKNTFLASQPSNVLLITDIVFVYLVYLSYSIPNVSRDTNSASPTGSNFDYFI